MSRGSVSVPTSRGAAAPASPQAPSGLAARWRALPLLMRWVLIGAGVLLAYLYGFEKALDAINKFDTRSERDEGALTTYARSGDAFRQQSEAVSLGARRFGQIALPGDPQSRPSALNQAVDGVLRQHSVSDVTSTSRTSSMSEGPLTRYAGRDQRVERVVKDLSFQCTPEVLHAMLADMERVPEVATISRVQVRQADDRDKANRLLKVTMAVETWTIAPKSAAASVERRP
jgi:hypothetical protein